MPGKVASKKGEKKAAAVKSKPSGEKKKRTYTPPRPRLTRLTLLLGSKTRVVKSTFDLQWDRKSRKKSYSTCITFVPLMRSVSCTMSGLSIQTLLSRDLSRRIDRYLELFCNLVNAFQRIVPTMQQVLVNITDKYQSECLCRSIKRGAEETLTFIKLVEGILLLKQDKERKERIYAELGYTAEGNSGGKHYVCEVSDVATRYQEFANFEAELKSRLEGVRSMQLKIANTCQEIEQKSRDLFKNDPTRNQNTGDMHVVAFVLGSLIFGALLIMNERFFHFSELIFAPLAWCGSLAPAFIRHFSNEVGSESSNEVGSERDIIQTFVNDSSELKNICGLESDAIIYKTALVSEVELSLDQFFTPKHAEFEAQITKKKDELEKIITNLEELC